MLWGRRYLVVLDDMWSIEAWEEIQMFLPDNGNGSCVIVTTRLLNLATCLSSSPLEMRFLGNNKSWKLFCGKVFGEEDCPIELEEIGKKIVERCGGLPLSIVVIGGHLRKSSREIEYWEKVASLINPISSIGADADDQCLKIISLSYEHLPACLKPCFLYMGIFGERVNIKPYVLVRYWVAEGFVKPKEGLSLEEVAETYLKDLIDRNLVLLLAIRRNGKLKYCVIHDTVRELCMKMAKKEKFMCVPEDATQVVGIQREERRIVITNRKKLRDRHITTALKSTPLLRTLIRQQGGKYYFEEFSRLLRLSVDIHKILKHGEGYFPGANFHQVNLRCLAFSCRTRRRMTLFNRTPYLPSSISLLWNMQTLILKNFNAQITAPYEIWEMPQLRHLEFKRFYLPDPIPSDQEEECIVLHNLHTLKGVENLRLTQEVCKRMPNIKVLSLLYDDHLPCSEASSYYCSHNLGRFNKLESLKCKFGDDVVLRFTFPTSLMELCLRNCHLRWEGLSMMIASLPHLRYLRLGKLEGPEWNLVDEEFSSLEYLEISCCEELIYWNANSSHFPVLKYLHILETPKLGEIPFDIGEVPTLKVIRLEKCSLRLAMSATRILTEQLSLDNHQLKLNVYFPTVVHARVFCKMVEKHGLTTIGIHIYYYPIPREEPMAKRLQEGLFTLIRNAMREADDEDRVEE